MCGAYRREVDGRLALRSPRCPCPLPPGERRARERRATVENDSTITKHDSHRGVLPPHPPVKIDARPRARLLCRVGHPLVVSAATSQPSPRSARTRRPALRGAASARTTVGDGRVRSILPGLQRPSRDPSEPQREARRAWRPVRRHRGDGAHRPRLRTDDGRHRPARHEGRPEEDPREARGSWIQACVRGQQEYPRHEHEREDRVRAYRRLPWQRRAAAGEVPQSRRRRAGRVGRREVRRPAPPHRVEAPPPA